MAAPVGRPAGLPKVPGSGRQKKSLDRQQRQLVSAQLAHSILATFEMLGGTAAMVEWAHGNQTVFYTQILSRLMPAPQKDPDIEINVNPSANSMSEREAAIRIAFVLNSAVYQGEPAPVAERVPDAETTPQAACDWRAPVQPAPQGPPDPDRQRWIDELSLTPQERADNALIRETREVSLESYAGSASEQGGSSIPRPSRVDRPTVAEKLRRRRDLL